MTKTNQTLIQLQADATVFYQKLRTFHWTVTGERFFQLHKAFEEAYTRWAEHIDDFAERILINGGTPLLTLAAVSAAAKIEEDAGGKTPKAMVETVLADLRTMVAALDEAIAVAESEGQRGTVNLLDGIRDEEEKVIWMLSASLR